uniref:Integrin alpha ina-1 n=1 Tax=Ascaris suum TaxID=6253 RepID=F1KQ70_ASCSU
MNVNFFPLRRINSLLRFAFLLVLTNAFNIDTHAPIFKIGPTGSYFGFSVAEHFNGEQPVILVGAPRAESGQPGTEQAGAVFSCPLTATYTKRGPEWCQQQNVEYLNAEDMKRPVGFVHGRQLHFQGKNRQLLGSVVASSGTPNGIAMACAPLVRYHNTSAYTDGTCFVLESDLTQKEMLVSCSQPGLPRTDRHNEFGSCMEGFSGYVSESLIITGLPGAKKWTGGVFSRYYPKDMFAMNIDRWTMGVEPKAHGVRSKLQAHDYLGYSVQHGRFGFWYEDSKNSTIVSGATRYNQTGAVIFLPFKRGYASGSPTSHQLTLTEDSFMLLGSQLGSAFGYALEVTDLNNDGFDDLLVGAPFEYIENAKGSFGGAVYIYFSSGERRERHENSKVFLKPIRIRGPGLYSQFGLSIARLGNIDGDTHKYNDFAVGAPFADEGKGAVYIYHGAASPDELKIEPVQTITVDELSKVYPLKNDVDLRTVGFSMSGGVDLDKNGYNDLVVGAFASDTVTILRARPVINIHTRHLETDLKVDIDGDSSCVRGAQTCFYITTELSVDLSGPRSSHQLLNFDSDVFQCTLEVIALSAGVGTRAKIVASRNEKYIWACGRSANIKPQTRKLQLYIPNKNSDWINPLKLRFSVKIRDDTTPEMPQNGGEIVDLNKFPVLNKFGSEHSFNIHFNKKCGSDNICTCDLQLQPVLPGISKEDDGTYVTQVGEKAAIDISFVVTNNGERAYEAMLFMEYNSDELDVPVLSKKGGSVNLKGSTDNLAILSLGNPMEPNKKLKFELSFKLARGRTEGLGRPLEFRAYVNSTSEEKNLDDNDWEATVRVIKRAELEMTAVSDPAIVRFGGDIKGESAMEFDEDIGPLVLHKYTITNKGPWSVTNVTVQVDWPHQVASVFTKGKWALYLLETPTIQTTNTDNSNVVKKCSMALPTEWVNPLQLKLFLDSGSSYDLDDDDDFNEPSDEINRRIRREAEGSKQEARPSRELRIKATKIKEKSGEEVEIVRISCAEKSAKCFTVTCHFDFLDVDASALMEFRSRLWNATFVEDYYDVTYVEISSSGRLLLDPDQGIEERDTTNNFASASTHAYPDRPAIQETAPIPWWVIAAAVGLGLLILVILILIFWKCGFFKRNRPNQPTLHQAEYQFRQEEWTES